MGLQRRRSYVRPALAALLAWHLLCGCNTLAEMGEPGDVVDDDAASGDSSQTDTGLPTDTDDADSLVLDTATPDTLSPDLSDTGPPDTFVSGDTADADPGSCAPAADTVAVLNPNTGRCYRLVDITMTWGAAEAYCQAQWGGHLVAVADQLEQNAMVQMLDGAYNTEFNAAAGFVWIGLHSDAALAWSWTDPGTPAVWPAGWASGRPVLQTPACGYASADLSYRWGDAPCEELKYVLCEH